MISQSLMVILCHLPEKGKRDSRGDEREGREERGTGLKVKKQKK